MNSIHPYQLEILKKLMYNPHLRFSDLQIKDLTSKHFNYHLKELVALGLIEKGEKEYVLTLSGKDYVSRVDDTNMDLEKQPKVSVALFVSKVDNNGVKKYLICKRLKQPYFGMAGGFTGKVRFGETFLEAARRELMEETGLVGDFTFTDTYRKMAYIYDEHKIKKFVQDNIMLLFKVENVRGHLITDSKEHEAIWCTKEELYKRTDLFQTFLKFLEMSERNNNPMTEEEHEAEGY